MAGNNAAARCSLTLRRASVLVWRDSWSNAGGRLSGAEGQRRWYAKEASVPKTATPNAAKNVKAKNASKREEKKEQRERFNDLIDSCLNAAPPVRALKEKEKLRLLEREKLGIISPERLREIEQAKGRGKAAKRTEERAAAKSSVEDVRIQDRLVPEEFAARGEFELTAEEGKRLAKQLSRVLFMEERERARGEVVRLRLKQNAIAALPEHLRQAALVPDFTPFPKQRIPASLTPPIQGYIEDRASAAAQAVTVKKSR